MNLKFRLDLKYKAGILTITMMLMIISDTIRFYAINPFWMVFLAVSSLIFGCLTLFLYIIWFLIEHVEFRAQPEMASKIIERERKIMELETEMKILKLKEKEVK